MTPMRAILAYLGGVEAHQRQGAVRPSGLRLRYLGGHPGIPAPGTFWVERVGDRLRLEACEGQVCYDLLLGRIWGLIRQLDGRLVMRYEPTPGLMAWIQFQSPGGGADAYLMLARLMSRGA